jgi:sulfotransferase family protein
MNKLSRYIKSKILHLYQTSLGMSWPIAGKALQIQSRFFGPQKKIHTESIFFVLSTGRSGTNFLSHFLNKNRSVQVYHEPDFLYDVATLHRCKRSEIFAARYFNQYRKHAIGSRMRESGEARYGEVTGTLRYHAAAIQKTFPTALIFLMTRDGRDVIRSAWRWKFYKKGTTGAYHIRPNRDDPYFQKWKKMTRFEKLCWSWMDSNEQIIQHIPEENIFRFERIIEDYDYLNDKLLRPLGIDVDKEEWMLKKSIKSDNASVQYEFPHWTRWETGDREAFNDICGPTMLKLGYDL